MTPEWTNFDKKDDPLHLTDKQQKVLSPFQVKKWNKKITPPTKKETPINVDSIHFWFDIKSSLMNTVCADQSLCKKCDRFVSAFAVQPLVCLDSTPCQKLSQQIIPWSCSQNLHYESMQPKEYSENTKTDLRRNVESPPENLISATTFYIATVEWVLWYQNLHIEAVLCVPLVTSCVCSKFSYKNSD